MCAVCRERRWQTSSPLPEPAAAGATCELRRTKHSFSIDAESFDAAAKVDFLQLVQGVNFQARWLFRR